MEIHRSDDRFAKQRLGDLPSQAARRWGTREALVFENERFTFEDVDRSVDRLAKGLIALGIQPGEKIAVWYPNRPGWIHAFFAILKVGAVVVPLNTRLRVEDVAYALNAADVSVLIIADRAGPVDFLGMTREVLSGRSPRSSRQEGLALDLERIIVDGTEIDHEMTAWTAMLAAGESVSSDVLARRSAGVDPDRAAMLLFTSGSTGNPKGVVHCHSPIRNVADEVDRMGISESDSVLMYLPLFHTLGLYEGALTLMVAGARMVLQERFDPDESLRLIERERCTVIHGFDTHFGDLLRSPELELRDTESLRTGILAAGMASTEAVARDTQNRLMKAVSGWGMTEVGCGALLGCASDDEDARCLGSGHPLPGYELRVVDPEDCEVRKDGEIGELQVRTYQMFLEYYKDPLATASSFTPDGWFRTGDQACKRSDGSFRFLGRYKDMLKVGGENVDPSEVESFLKGHPLVSDAQIVGYPDPRLGEVVVACVIPKEGSAPTREDIMAHCRGRIASFKVPRHVVLMSEYPTTSSGKVQRFLLRERVARRVQQEGGNQ